MQLGATLTLTPAAPGSRSPASWNVGLQAGISINPAQIAALPIAERTVELARDALEATRTLAAADIAARSELLEAALTAWRSAADDAERARQTSERIAARVTAGSASPLEASRAAVEALRAIDALIAAQAALDATLFEVLEANTLTLQAEGKP